MAAAALLTPLSGPAIAAADTPSLGPMSFYNMTPYQVELFFNFVRDGTCSPPGGPGATPPGTRFTYQNPRGTCKVSDIHVTAYTQDNKGPTIIASLDWVPTDPNSQQYNQWVVMQVQDGSPRGSIQAAQIVGQ